MSQSECGKTAMKPHVHIANSTEAHFPTLNRTFLSIILESWWADSSRIKMSPNFSDSYLHSDKKPELHNKSKHPGWVTEGLCMCVCVFNVPKTTVSGPVSFPSSQSLSDGSFMRKMDTPSFYDWRAAINTPTTTTAATYSNTPRLQIWVAGKLLSPVTL